MFGLSAGEIAVLLFLFALIAGAGKLPALGERLGAAVGRLVSGRRPARRSDDERITVRPAGNG